MSIQDDVIKNATFGDGAEWSAISNKPTEFPPEAHTHPVSNLVTTGATDGDSVYFNGTDMVFGKPAVNAAQLPALAITTVTVVANEAARLALAGTVQEGDVVKQSDNGISYFKLSTGDGSNNSHWTVVYDADIVAADLALTHNSFIVGDVSGFGAVMSLSSVKALLGIKYDVLKVQNDNIVYTSNSTFQNHPDFQFELEANKTYQITGNICLTATNSGGFKWVFDVPAGATGVINGTSTTYFPGNRDLATGLSALYTATAMNAALTGYITTAGTAGNLIFRAAQNSAHVNSTTLHAGNTMRLTESNNE